MKTFFVYFFRFGKALQIKINIISIEKKSEMFYNYSILFNEEWS
jgi:hypothetical protein